jgi:hypothetical protein
MKAPRAAPRVPRPSLARWTPFAVVSAVSALSALSACGTPQQLQLTAPPSVRLTAPAGWRKVALHHEAVGPLTFVGSGRIARLELSDVGRAPRRALGALLGPVRSGDVGLSSGELAEVRCAYQALTMGPSRSVCSARDRDADRAQARPSVASALGSLRRQAAVKGARAVDRVRCFVQTRRRRGGAGRLWCEGRAHR